MGKKETVEDKIAALEKLVKEQEYADAVFSAGFDDPADYEAWSRLNRLRNLTLKSRRPAAEATRSGLITSGSIGLVSNGVTWVSTTT